MSERASERIAVSRTSPEEVFGVLGNEVRVDILSALSDAPNDRATFSTLREQIALTDSGNFNYHLGRLTGSFVRRTETDTGPVYELTHAGRRVVGAIHAGTYTADAEVDAFSAGWDCQLCGGDFRVSYADERARFECADCGKGAAFGFPAGSLESFAREELPAAFASWWHALVTRVTDGFCPACAGRLDATLASPPEGPADDPSPSEARFDCRECGADVRVSGSTVATMHPIVEGFLAEHGFDVTERHASQVWGELDEWRTDIRSENPLRLTVHFGDGGDHVAVDIGPDARVTDVRRTR